MARYLRRAGYAVTIVLTDLFGRLPQADEQGIVRTGDLRSVGPLRRLLRRGEVSAAVGAPPGALLTKVVVPDLHSVTWLPGALVAVRRLIRRGEVDCLVTTVARLDTCARADARRPTPSLDRRLQRRLAFRAFARTVSDSDTTNCRRLARTPGGGAGRVAVGATRPIADDLRSRLGAKAVHVPNGWDPEVAPAAKNAPPGDKGPSGEVTLVYTGTLSGVRGTDPTPFLRALARIRAEPAASGMRLRVAGRLTTTERELIDRSGAADAVEHVGVLDRAGAIALQRSADALLLITSRSTSVATGKIYEYLGSGRPIVALAQGNEAARIV